MRNASFRSIGRIIGSFIFMFLNSVSGFGQTENSVTLGGMNFWIILLIVVIGIYLITVLSVYLKAKKAISEMSMGATSKRSSNPSEKLLLCLAVTILFVIGFKTLVTDGGGTYNYIMFAALPYVCIAVFLIGSVYRYVNKGFKVSSLSSQFLETRQLFWGSQPFHWGILVLFFGHLLAFLVPSAVIAWNGTPMRLMILEISSFIFGLAALFGLILLIRRRLSNKRLHVISNTMDMVVYALLLLQIVSGLGVAFFDRWGSSWFASSLTPYLRSVFAFDPQIEVVSAMPWEVQLHIVSAFLIIGIIPFTRFMHFLVAPIDYLWRSYQLVIWNYNHKRIRKSRSYFPGIKTKNH